MAAGAPVVAHHNDGYKWVLKDTGRISLVDCKNSEEYAARMQLMLEDNDIRLVWQKWAKKYVKQFDYEKIVDAYEKLYNENIR
jgi:glycosyltransferase involved in cell wall biosynthesis